MCCTFQRRTDGDTDALEKPAAVFVSHLLFPCVSSYPVFCNSPASTRQEKKIVWFVSATFAGYEVLAGWCLFPQKVDLVVWKVRKPQTKAAQATAGHGRIQAFVCLWRVRRRTFAGFRALVFPQQSSEVHLWNKLPLLPWKVDLYF